MRAAFSACLAMMAACVDEPAMPDLPQPLDLVWHETIRTGDVMILVPGTGTHDYLGTPIEALPEPVVVDVRQNETVASDSVVFEQAIASARRAGLTDDEIEGGALTFLIWGVGFQHLEAFDYISYEGLRLHINVLGGQNSVAVGFIADNLIYYNAASTEVDARDLYTRFRDWLTAHPSSTQRNAIVVSHSWGGAVSEYLTLEYAAIESSIGVLPGETAMPFTVAAGVPAWILNYTFIGPSSRDFARPRGGEAFLYEIDRPDDPVHMLTFEGDYGGHHYNILYGDEFRGSYGISTTDLDCHGVPGPCVQ